MRLPEKKNINPTEIADPLKFYYLPISSGFYKKRLDMVGSMIQNNKNDRLLDIGCGSGIFLKELETKCKNLYAMDIHRKMHLVKSMIDKEKINAYLYEGSITHLPFDSEVFNCIISVSVIEHVSDLDRAFSEINRVAQKNAIIVLGFPVKNVITDTIFKISYKLLPNAKLEEEHVSNHIEIISAAKQRYKNIEVSYFPAFFPLSFSAYCTIKIVKRE